MLSENSCSMPWVHLHVDTRGNVKACCSSNIVFGNLNNQTLTDIWNGDSIKKFRINTLNNIKDKRCGVCWKREDAGKSSLRVETNTKFKDVDLAKLKAPVYLDIRFSNVCNLKCLTCWHGASSSWFSEAKIKGTNWGDKAVIKATENNDLLLDQILEFSDDILEIYFAGGEPLMMEEHYALLEELLKRGKQKTFLRYNTNLTMLSFKDKSLLELWHDFENIEVAVSVDALGKDCEEIRRGLKWGPFIANCRKVSSLENVKFVIAPTISSLNIHSLHELHKFFYSQELIAIDDIYFNTLDRPFEFSVKSIKEKPEINKLMGEYIEWLYKKKASKYIINEVLAILNYMNG
mgnify:CR=1 FL=1